MTKQKAFAKNVFHIFFNNKSKQNKQLTFAITKDEQKRLIEAAAVLQQKLNAV